MMKLKNKKIAVDRDRAIQNRYAAEATGCSSLSCGGALDLAAPGAGETLLDLGSGRGGEALRAARLTGAGGRVYGVDFSDEMLAAAEKNRRREGVENVEFVRGDIAAIPLPDELVDVVVSNCVINHAPDKEAVFREIHRLLKKGGRFVVSDVVAEEPLPPEVTGDPLAWAGCYGGAIPREEYLEAAGNAGFRELEVLEESAPYLKGGVRIISWTVRGWKKGALEAPSSQAREQNMKS